MLFELLGIMYGKLRGTLWSCIQVWVGDCREGLGGVGRDGGARDKLFLQS